MFLYKNETMINGLMGYLDSFKLIYQVMLFTLCGIIIAIYLFIWNRMKGKLNEIIYKSKTIIPIEVLVILSSVQKIFKLNTKIDQ